MITGMQLVTPNHVLPDGTQEFYVKIAHKSGITWNILYSPSYYSVRRARRLLALYGAWLERVAEQVQP